MCHYHQQIKMKKEKIVSNKKQKEPSALLKALVWTFTALSIAYSAFLIMSYNRNIVIGLLITTLSLSLYLAVLFYLYRENNKLKISKAKAIFFIIGGAFLLFLANFFTCMNSFKLNLH